MDGIARMAVVGFAILFVLAAGCGGPEHDWRLVGTWASPRHKSNALIFWPNGSGEYRSIESPQEFSWQSRRNTLSIEPSGGTPQDESSFIYSVRSNGVLELNLNLFGYRTWNQKR